MLSVVGEVGLEVNSQLGATLLMAWKTAQVDVNSDKREVGVKAEANDGHVHLVFPSSETWPLGILTEVEHHLLGNGALRNFSTDELSVSLGVKSGHLWVEDVGSRVLEGGVPRVKVQLRGPVSE